MKAPGIYTEGKTARHPVPPLALGGGGQGREDSETPPTLEVVGSKISRR